MIAALAVPVPDGNHMVIGFDILLSKMPSHDDLVRELANTYGIDTGAIDLQYADSFDASTPLRPMFCLAARTDSEELPLLITISSFETESNDDIISIACKLSSALGCCAIIESGSVLGDYTRLLINGFAPPTLVVLEEESDERTNTLRYSWKALTE